MRPLIGALLVAVGLGVVWPGAPAHSQGAMPLGGFDLPSPGDAPAPFRLPSGEVPVIAELAATARGCATERCHHFATLGWRSELAKCAEGIRIGLLGTGADITHPAFAGRALTIREFKSGRPTPSANWHGTAVLALLAGAADSATPGLIPDARFFVADVFSPGADGAPTTNISALLEGLAWLAQSGVQIVNLSLSGPYDALLHAAIHRLSATGIIFVAPAGDGGPHAPPSYPAAYPEVIAVTAVDHTLRADPYANRGSYIDVAAPGVLVWTAFSDNKVALASGTAYAAPMVTAAVAAIYRSLGERSKPEVLRRLGFTRAEPAPDRAIYGLGVAKAPDAAGCR